MSDTKVPEWLPVKMRMDALDDGQGPQMAWLFSDEHTRHAKQIGWCEFVVWALDTLGQGYSLACCEGTILDPTTAWAYAGFLAGKGII